MVVDREGIEARLRRLEDCVSELRRIRPATLEAYAHDRGLRDRCERNLQVAIQCALDAGNHIIAEEILTSPEDQADILRILASEGILPQELAERILPMAGFRNILVHEYLRLDHIKVFETLTRGLDDLEEFARHIQSWLDRKSTR